MRVTPKSLTRLRKYTEDLSSIYILLSVGQDLCTVMRSLVGRDRRNSCWDQEEKVWGKRRLAVQ